MEVYVDANPNQTCYVACHPTINKAKRTTIIKDLITPHTNNEAEYMAIIFALEDLSGHLEIKSDSQLVVRQLNHQYAIKVDKLRDLAKRVWELVFTRQKEGESTTFEWVPRKENLAGKVLG